MNKTISVIMLLGLAVPARACCTGAAGTTAANFMQVDVDPTGTAGGAFSVDGTGQLSGDLVTITGVASKSALKVINGNTNLAGTTTVSTITDGTLSCASGTITGAADVTATGFVQCGNTGFKVSGTKVVGAQGTAVADTSAAIAADGGISATYAQAEVEALRDAVAELQTQLNSLLAKVRTHGLIAT